MDGGGNELAPDEVDEPSTMAFHTLLDLALLAHLAQQLLDLGAAQWPRGEEGRRTCKPLLFAGGYGARGSRTVFGLETPMKKPPGGV